MNLLHRMYLPHILLVVFVTGTVLHAQVMSAPAAAPSAGAVSPMSEAPVAATPPKAIKPSAGFSYSYDPVVRDLVNTGSPTESVLVVPGKPMDPQAVGQMAEDLTIMRRIIEKNALVESSAIGGVGEVGAYSFYPVYRRPSTGPGLFFPCTGRAKPMYLGGYGVAFFIEVDYPLLPPATPQEQQAEQSQDAVWAQAKRDLLDPRADVGLPDNGEEIPEPYSRDRVDALRTSLITTMKHATNIRALEGSEWVALVVRGPQAAAAGKTTMTLRATKSDVDQFAKGQLSQQQFEQRVQTMTY